MKPGILAENKEIKQKIMKSMKVVQKHKHVQSSCQMTHDVTKDLKEY